jgi:hypothetical protein
MTTFLFNVQKKHVQVASGFEINRDPGSGHFHNTTTMLSKEVVSDTKKGN